MKPIHIALLAFAVVSLGACETGLDRRYLDAGLGQSLELPPDLSRDEVRSNFELPANFSGDDPNARGSVPVLARVDTLELEGSAGLYWLSVEEPVDNLYQQVKNFWASEGYRLVLDEPVIGIMQTEWIFKEEGSEESGGNWLEQLFGEDDLSATQDQFRTRIERGDDGRSRIYVAHRGTEYNFIFESSKQSEITAAQPDVVANESDSAWRFRQPEPELEIEMLSRLMVYLGLQQDQVESQVANVKLFKPRAYMQIDAEENTPFVVMREAYQIAWNRVYHSLERLDFDIASAEFNTGLGFTKEGVITVNAEVVETREEEGFFSMFTTKEEVGRQFVLVLTPESHDWTRVYIETEKGDYDTTPEGAEFLSLLFDQVK